MTKPKDEKSKDDPEAIKVRLDPNKSEGKRKLLGGGKADEWNDRLSDLTVNALPIAHSKNKDAFTGACVAVAYGALDMAPADPIEGILIAQLIAANEAALSMYQRGWLQPPGVFRDADEISATGRQGSADGGAVDREARPPSRPRPATDHREARHHEQRHGRSGDHCRERHHRRRSYRVSWSPGCQLWDAYAYPRRDEAA